LVTSEFHIPRVKYIAERVLNMNQEILLCSSVPDEELDEDLLKRLYEHEKQAIDHLKLNYRIDLF